MSVFSHPEFDQHEHVSFFQCQKTGLKAIIAVHNTHLGPALGGCRMWAYENDEQALRDVLRLSRGMTYKAALAGLTLGGGKSVIIGDSRKVKTADLMRAMGRAVDSFNGRYIIAEDVGTSEDDMNQIRTQTKHVVGIAEGGHGAGDPSPLTALGVYNGIKAAAKLRLNKPDLRGLKIAVQGLGHVGWALARHLHADGVKLIVTDVQADRVEQAKKDFGAEAVTPADIYSVEADIFAPCALGAIINDETLKRLKVKAVAGAANNQLAKPLHGEALKELNILYAPDFVINAGGLICVYYEYLSRTSGKPYDKAQMTRHVESIGSTVESVIKRAEQDGIATSAAADKIAEQKFKNKQACKAA